MSESFVKRLTKGVIEDIELRNRARRECGLVPIKITVRKCLTCGILFESAGNRTCGCLVTRPAE